MPSFQLSLIFRILERSKLAESIKAISTSILDRGGILQTYENMGEKKLPYVMRDINNEKHYNGFYFLINYYDKVENETLFQDELDRNGNLLNAYILRNSKEISRPCDNEECVFGELNDEKSRKLNKWLKTCVKQL